MTARREEMTWMGGDAAAGDIRWCVPAPAPPSGIDNPAPMRHYGTRWTDRAAGAGRIGRTGLQGDLT